MNMKNNNSEEDMLQQIANDVRDTKKATMLTAAIAVGIGVYIVASLLFDALLVIGGITETNLRDTPTAPVAPTDQMVTLTQVEETARTQPIDYSGEYEPQQGIGGITLVKQADGYIISGETTLPGEGNMASEEVMNLRTGTLSGMVQFTNGVADYTDSQLSSCTLTFTMQGTSLSISGGQECEVTVSEFVGEWNRM